VGWSKDIHHILQATKEDEIEQRDLYDRPPSVRKPWTDGNVALLGDAGKVCSGLLGDLGVDEPNMRMLSRFLVNAPNDWFFWFVRRGFTY
jgi:hypothetical protein